MKEMILICIGVLMMASCATPKAEVSTTGKVSANERKLARQAEVRQAVEMKRFIVRLNRLYLNRGGRIELIPSSNYIILNGDRVVISAAYLGRQFGTRPIKGIDMVGKAVISEIKNKPEKGIYEIRLKVTNEQNTFDVYLTVSSSGYCDASVSNYRIDRVRYTGDFYPLKQQNTEDKKEDQQDNEDPAYMSI